MNNKGMSLVTVIVIIIVMIIIATVSIIAGNKLVFEAKTYREDQTTETVREAIARVYQELVSSGKYTPKGETLVGRYSPAIGDGTVQATGWYLLDESSLKELGVQDLSGRYLVNYEYAEVLSMSDPYYLEKYSICEFVHEQKELSDTASLNLTGFTYPGEPLKTIANGEGVMYSYFNPSRQTELFGTGWYYITPSDISEDYAGFVKNDYLVNYDSLKYVQKTSSFVRVTE